MNPIRLARWSTLVLTLALLAATITSSAQQSRNPYVADLQTKIEGKEDQPAEEVFENIRILEGVPAGRLLTIMERGFAPALGVSCDHCHVIDHWEADEKEPKRIARGMWGMVGGINAELREIAGEDAQAVNCSTCHQGNEKPPAP
ncbi:MAG: photosynthetic reaction center cytochrome c subunit family protein [Thermoanaerobaculia bacterium]|nr:photosynthetic reaction center cytochrome c subunit family protein [Thermoanaerobaculia bacterium]